MKAFGRSLVAGALLLLESYPPPLTAQAVPIEFDLLFTIGEFDGEVAFGDVEGVAVDPRTGTIVATDHQWLRMYAFAPDGSLLDVVGAHGNGPGEFGSASRPVLIGGTILYPDARNQWIGRWTIENGSLVHLGEHRFELMSNYHCGSEEHLYIQLYRDGGLIERVDPGTFEGARFGRPVYEAEGINPAFVLAQMACTADDEVYLASGMSVLRKYDGRTGTLLWEREIPGVVAPEVLVGPGGLPQYRRRSGEAPTIIVSVVPIPDGPFLLQTSQERLAPVPGATTTSIVDVETFLFNAETGELIEQRGDLPRIDYAAGDRAYAWPSTPFPQIRVYRLEVRE